MSLAAMKKQNSLDSLLGAAQKESAPQEKKSYVDERLWKPTMDKSGNGYAVIRFLPAPDGEDLPWAQVWSHAFQGPGGWYIENSLTTLGQKDPVGELNRTLWNSGLDSDKEIARKQKRKLSYYSNIYVVKDQLNPQNEGKVFLYKYGKKIHDKIDIPFEFVYPESTETYQLVGYVIQIGFSTNSGHYVAWRAPMNGEELWYESEFVLTPSLNRFSPYFKLFSKSFVAFVFQIF